MKTYIMLFSLITFNVESKVPNVFVKDTKIIAEQINENFNKNNAADYDSGWLPVETESNHHTDTLVHNLGVIPSKLTLMFTESLNAQGEPNIVVYANPMNYDFFAPMMTSVSKNKIAVQFHNGRILIRCSTPGTVPEFTCLDRNGNKAVMPNGNSSIEYRTGYMKVLLWK